ncbi:MAG: FAD-dependent oxidoreductase [Actinomycetota bacterium]|nr:FAD-dependent oxidoreductase [Actinomycetota bacterium]
MARSSSPPHVVVAGGGFAAAELVLAVRVLAEERVTLELIAPSPRLAFKPAATGEAFGASTVQEFDLRELAEDAGATYRRDTVEAVASKTSRLRLASGATAHYDALVLATGARAHAVVPGATTYRDQRDSPAIARMLAELRASAISAVAFAAPAGVTWTLPLYELALLTARELDDHGLSARVTLVTPERAPLEVFGPAVSAAVGQLLAERDVFVEHSTRPRSVTRGGLELAHGGLVPADRVIAIPRLTGRRLSGVPADWSGFVTTDEDGRVEDLHGVFAAGDMTRFPVKQGGLATQQADVIAAELARRAGVDVPREPTRYVLRTQLLGADGPLFLQAELDGRGRPIADGGEPPISTEAPWWPAAKLFGRHLSPWMAARARPVADATA